MVTVRNRHGVIPQNRIKRHWLHLRQIMTGLIIALWLSAQTPKFELGEIFKLSYADRYGVVIAREWTVECGFEYTVVPAEIIFPNGTKEKD